MRHYDVAVTAVAIHAPFKWVDNVLSQHAFPEVIAARRGVTRRIAHAGVRRLALVRELHMELGLSVREAVALSARLLGATDGDLPVRAGELLGIVLDRATLDARVERGLREALESAPVVRRGRPPRASNPPGEW